MIEFTPRDDCEYKFDYEAIFTDVANGHLEALPTWRSLILEDLWFIVYFVMQVKVANHPFWVNACREVETGPKSKTIDLWAREHGKSTIITKAETIQRILKDPEERVGIFSHTRPAAKSFLRSIKHILEGSDLLKASFDDILFANPSTEAPKWSEDDGLIIRRKGFYNEATIEAWGLLEGMPTGKHFTHRVYDDIVTADHVNNPETMQRLKDAFDLSQNLGVLGSGTHRVIGTHYHHEDPLVYIRYKRNIHKKLVYKTRIKPATVDGTPNGDPVLLSKEDLDELKSGDEYIFNCQQLLNPTPVGHTHLDASMLQEVEPENVPPDMDIFMMVDPAGDNQGAKKKKQDSWGILACGVVPDKDNIGQSDVYIVDAFISPCGSDEAIEQITRMYLRNGIVQKLGIEKAGLSMVEAHVAGALEKHGRRLNKQNGSLVTLMHASRNKTERIKRAIQWPLHNGKIYISKAVPGVFRERIKQEMEKFPFWHDDGIDALAYLYDMIKDHRFRSRDNTEWLEAVSREKTWKPYSQHAGF